MRIASVAISNPRVWQLHCWTHGLTAAQRMLKAACSKRSRHFINRSRPSMGALKLRKVEIQGFRSFGTSRQTLDLADTVSVLWGGNIQGKTSLAEAIEVLLTWYISRRELLASAKDEFSDSLGNVHIPPTTPVVVEAEFICA